MPNCFPSVATVETENGKSLRMSRLQVGDMVKTGMDMNIHIPEKHMDFTTQTQLSETKQSVFDFCSFWKCNCEI